MIEVKLLYKLEKKIGKYAIPNLSLYIVICFAIGYILQIFFPQIYVYLPYESTAVLVGHQYWRIFTWIFTVPGAFDFFTLIMLFFYYSIGNSIERATGTFLYNIYIFGGLFLSTVGALIAGIISINSIETIGDLQTYLLGSAVSGVKMTYYLTISIFLLYAYIYSDAIVLLFLLIPFRVKWLAYIDLLLLAYEFANDSSLIGRVTIITCILNFVLFYAINENYKKKGYRRSSYMRRSSASKKQKSRFSVVDGGAGQGSKEKKTPDSITRHKCAICGRSERDGDELEFRFCSKCNGNYEYCSEHLYTHEHVK